MRRKFCIIHNPRAGWHSRHLFSATLEALRSAAASYEIVSTECRGQGTDLAKAAARSASFDAIIAAGGDGTIHDVAAGLVGGQVPLGVIPLGTGNVFARALGYVLDASALSQALLNGPVKRIPIGEANGEPFLFVVGIGFDAEAVRYFEAHDMRRWGVGSFAIPVLHALMHSSNAPLQVTTPAGCAEAQWVLVTRTEHYAANLLLAPEADLRDPMFYVIRVEGAGRLIRTRQLAAMLTGLLRHDPAVTVEAARHIRIEGDSGTPVQIDGEFKGTLPMEIALHAAPLRAILPAP
jgi:YegS/Rv2252/BmrU family lipid kinase